jgi:probable HAF family extracellular repeat protein
MRRISRLAAGAAISALIVSTGAATSSGAATPRFPAPSVTVTMLQLLQGHDTGSVSGINEFGQVVGSSFRSGSIVTTAALWQNGKITDLGLGEATAINNLGQIAITDFEMHAGTETANLWWYGHVTPIAPDRTQAATGTVNLFGEVAVTTVLAKPGASSERIGVWHNGTLSDVTLPGFTGPDVPGPWINEGSVNDFGQLAGTYQPQSGASFAFRCTGTSCMKLPDPAGMTPQHVTALPINDFGEMAGTEYDNSWRSVAVKWTGGQAISLGTLGGQSSFSSGQNSWGDVVGSSLLADGNQHGFLWHNGKMIDIGTLGGLSSRASAINDLGEIVGSSSTANGESHGFLWRNGQMIDLGSSGGYVGPVALNCHGQIIGMIITASGQYLPVMWTVR